ncbi:MAG: hypothetical protein PF448_06650 [Bacteroidales bacterium]|nr:hypothetical protein [Bacteroidales bacterium]
MINLGSKRAPRLGNFAGIVESVESYRSQQSSDYYPVNTKFLILDIKNGDRQLLAAQKFIGQTIDGTDITSEAFNENLLLNKYVSFEFGKLSMG